MTKHWRALTPAGWLMQPRLFLADPPGHRRYTRLKALAAAYDHPDDALQAEPQGSPEPFTRDDLGREIDP